MIPLAYMFIGFVIGFDVAVLVFYITHKRNTDRAETNTPQGQVAFYSLAEHQVMFWSAECKRLNRLSEHAFELQQNDRFWQLTDQFNLASLRFESAKRALKREIKHES